MKFYSEVLNEMFDTEKALKEAEKAAAEKEAKKAAAAKEKKAEAAKVEDAFKAYNAAKKAYNEAVVARRKKYAEDLASLKAAFDEDVKAETNKLDESAKAYDEALSEFTAKHQNFHLTLKDGDNVVDLHSNRKTSNADILKTMLNDNWFDTFFNLFKI